MNKQVWRLIIHNALNPYYNMAVDEALLMSCAQGAQPAIRFYRWRENAVSIGYFQSAEDIEQSLNLPDNPVIVRRPTGGGAVIHGEDITFSLIFPEKLLQGTVVEGYRAINSAIMRTIEHGNRFSLVYAPKNTTSNQKATRLCFANPTRFDILWDNRKVGGSAQRRRNGVILHQSSFYYKKCVEDADSYDKDLRHNYVLAIQTAISCLFGVSFQDAGLTYDENQTAHNLYTERYSTKEWNYRR